MTRLSCIGTMNQLPLEIVELIIEFHEGLRVTMIQRIQQWWRSSLTKCEDCYRIRRAHNVITTPACADYQSGLMCCHKQVCIDGCEVFCDSGHPNISFSDDGYHEVIHCHICGCRVRLAGIWYGELSPKEWRERYD